MSWGVSSVGQRRLQVRSQGETRGRDRFYRPSDLNVPGEDEQDSLNSSRRKGDPVVGQGRTERLLPHPKTKIRFPPGPLFPVRS